MADLVLSSDIEQPDSPPQEHRPKKPGHKSFKPTTRRAAGRKKASSPLPSKRSTSSVKDAQRLHKALERQFAKAQQKAHSTQLQVASNTEAVLPGPDNSSCTMAEQLHSGPSEGEGQQQHFPFRSTREDQFTFPSVMMPKLPVVPSPRRPAPEAMVTPTAAGLRLGEGQSTALSMDIQTFIVETISKAMALGFQQEGYFPSMSASLQLPASLDPGPGSPSQQDSTHSTDFLWGDDDLGDPEFSEDEGLLPDKPAFTGLFRPSIFKSLLHKAKVSTNMGVSEAPVVQSQGAHHPHDDLLVVPSTEQEFIPCPKLFAEVIQKQWSQPGSLAAPSGHNKKLYCTALDLDGILQLPSIDAPVANLVSSAVFSNHIVELLKAEDRKVEVSCRKTHQAAAWAIKTVTSAFFFNHASLMAGPGPGSSITSKVPTIHICRPLFSVSSHAVRPVIGSQDIYQIVGGSGGDGLIDSSTHTLLLR